MLAVVGESHADWGLFSYDGRGEILSLAVKGRAMSKKEPSFTEVLLLLRVLH